MRRYLPLLCFGMSNYYFSTAAAAAAALETNSLITSGKSISSSLFENEKKIKKSARYIKPFLTI
jgi:hypothetical protein